MALKKARREHRTLVLWDEAGHRFRIRPGTTWARRGLTRCSSWRLYARHFCTPHLEPLCHPGSALCPPQDRPPLLVVWDRLNTRRSRATTAFIASHVQDYAVAYLPAYALELNPEEQCNALVKRAMANALPSSVDDLHRLARREFGWLKRRPEMIVSFFPHVDFSATRIP